MAKKNFLIWILALEMVFSSRVAIAQSRKIDKPILKVEGGDALVVAKFIEQFGSRPLKTNLVFWRIVRFMSDSDQAFYNKFLEKKSFGETPIAFERVSAQKIAIRWGEQSATLETISIPERKFRINGKPIQFEKTDSQEEVQSKINNLLGKKTTAMRGLIFDLLIPSAHAQDMMSMFSSMLGPVLQLVMQQMGIQAQASADCSAINQMVQYCTMVTTSSDPQRGPGGAGLDSHCIGPGTPIATKPWSAATHSKCGAQIQQLADLVNKANFQKMYGGWNPCSDPHYQGGGYVAVAYTIPCPANGQLGAGAAGTVAGNQAGGNIVAGAPIKMVHQVRADAITKPSKPVVLRGLR